MCFCEQPAETGPGRQRTSLSQVNQQSDINDLTVKQLKEILAANFVNYKGCCEKWELIDRVTRLWKEDRNNQLRGKIPSSVISHEERLIFSKENKMWSFTLGGSTIHTILSIIVSPVDTDIQILNNT